MKTDSIYDRLLSSSCEMDNHESDLYVKDTPRAREVMVEFMTDYPEITLNRSLFISQLDGKPWFELPFMFSPWWRSKALLAL